MTEEAADLEAADAPATEYHAFISYSHADVEQVKRFHQRVVRFGLPPWRRSRLKIFFDREQLEAGRELRDALREELRSSRLLLLVVTPASAKSDYVDAEVEYWLATRGAKTLIPVIGCWEGTRPLSEFDWSSQSLPKALQGKMREPLAADIRQFWNSSRIPRADHDTHREVMASLVARIDLEKTKEQLVGDERRRVREMRLAATIIAVILGLFAIGAASALRSSSQSDRAARESEAGKASIELATAALTDDHPDLRLLLAAEAHRIAPTYESAEALGTLLSGEPGPAGFLRAHDSAVVETHATVDGRFLWSLSADGSLARWDLNTAEVVVRSIGSGAIAGAISDDLLVAGSDDAIQAWSMDGSIDLVGSAEVASNAVEVTPSGSVFIGAEDGRVLATDATLDPLDEIARHDGEVRDIAATIDGSQLATVGDDGNVHLVDLTNGDVTTLTPTVSQEIVGMSAVTFSPDGDTLVAADATQHITFWNTEDLTEIDAVAVDMEVADDIAFSADGSLLMIGDSRGSVLALDVRSRALRDWPQRAHQDRSIHIGTIPSRDLLLSGGLDGVIVVWDPIGRNTLAAPLPGRIGARYSLESKTLVVIDDYGGLAALDEVGSQLWQWLEPGVPSLALVVYAETAIAGLANGDLVWVDLEDGTELKRLSDVHDSRVVQLEVDEDTSQLLSLQSDGRLAASSLKTGRQLWSVQTGLSRANRMVLDIDETLLVIGPEPPHVAVVDLASGEQLPTRPDLQDIPLAVAWARDVSLAARANESGVVIVQGADGSGSPTEFAVPSGAQVAKVALSPLGDRLAVLTDTGEVGIWDVDGQRILVPFRRVHRPFGGSALLFITTDRLISADHSTILDWNLDAERWAEIACSRAGRAATGQEVEAFNLDGASTQRCIDDQTKPVASWNEGTRLLRSRPDSAVILDWVNAVDLKAVMAGLIEVQNAYISGLVGLAPNEVNEACAALSRDERLTEAIAAFDQAPDAGIAESGIRAAASLQEMGQSCLRRDIAGMTADLGESLDATVDLASRLNEMPSIDIEELGLVD